MSPEPASMTDGTDKVPAPARIKASIAEVLARAEYEDNHKAELKMGTWKPWPAGPAGDTYRRHGRRLADALDKAGLLPTEEEIETCVAGRDGECGCPIKSRYVTPWRELSNGEAR